MKKLNKKKIITMRSKILDKKILPIKYHNHLLEIHKNTPI